MVRSGVQYLHDAIAGDRRALARLLTIVEDDGDEFEAVAADLARSPGTAQSVGLTGAPGAGKSTLTDAIVTEVRSRGNTVAVVAVDPSSPTTGGAILGDRVRLSESHTLDKGVFVRSLASRRHLGGLSMAVPAVIRTLAATGWEAVLVETVGVGQSEVAVSTFVDTTIVVVNPGWGDEVQAAKAGILEVADIFVVNKGDRPGAAATARDLKHVLHAGPSRAWMPPVVTTVATNGDGVSELWDQVAAHADFLESSDEGRARRANRMVDEMRERLLYQLVRAANRVETSSDGRAVIDRVRGAELDPVVAAGELVQLVGGLVVDERSSCR